MTRADWQLVLRAATVCVAVAVLVVCGVLWWAAS
jgi:hypothetical protein